MGDSHLLGEGTHGCVFTPPLHCRKSRKNKSRKVGKLIDKEHAEIELNVATLVKGIVGWQRYFIVQEEDDCDVANFKKIREESNKNCKIMRKTYNRNLTQLLSPYGGSTLHNLGITNSFDYMGSFKHMLEGIARLEKQGICHYDIKNNNIVVDSKGTLRLIDFGSAFVGNEVTTKNIWRHQYNFMPDYPPQPPELSLQNGIEDNIERDVAIKEIIDKKTVFKSLEHILGIPVERAEGEMRKFCIEEGMKKGDWVSFFHKYWNVWDSWAIGIIYLRILEKSLLLPKFVQEVWPVHGPIIKQLLKGLLRVDPRERLTGIEAARLLEF